MLEIIGTSAQCVMRLFILVYCGVFIFNSLCDKMGDVKALSVVAAIYWFVAATWIPFVL